VASVMSHLRFVEPSSSAVPTIGAATDEIDYLAGQA
jgi:hypothetical protein